MIKFIRPLSSRQDRMYQQLKGGAPVLIAILYDIIGTDKHRGLDLRTQQMRVGKVAWAINQKIAGGRIRPDDRLKHAYKLYRE